MSLPMRSSNSTSKPPGFPPSRPVLAVCSCGEQYVPIHAASEFIRALRELEVLAGQALSADLPFLTHRCKRGHFLVIPLGQLGR